MKTILLWFTLAAAVRFSAAALGAPDDLSCGNMSITARVLGEGGQPCQASITFWKALEDGGEVESPDHFWGTSERAQQWRDRVHGRTWKPIHNYRASAEATLGQLSPGEYRVTAALGNEPSPFGVSEVIHLDGTRPEHRVAIPLQLGPTLTVAAIDEQTQEPLPLFQAMLVRDDGFPVTRWSSAPWALWSREDEGRLEYRQLAPGAYHLEVRRPAFYASQLEYAVENGPIDIQVSSRVDRQITARLRGTALPDEAIRERWPFVVAGRVTDKEGQGLGGVTVTAHCGIGSLLPTGQATSGADGRYTLRFTGGMRMQDGGKWRVGLQAATISPAKPGYAEVNLHRQGDLLMADRLPEPKEDTGWKVEPGRVVLPNNPFPLDFVLVRAASLEGQLVDAQNRRLGGQRICLTGDELPPSCSVLAETRTDAEGRFRFDNVPPGRTWWFSLPEQQDARSRGLKIESPAVPPVRVRLETRDGKPALEFLDP